MSVGVAPVRPRHRAGVAGHQEEHRDGLERPGQPLGPGQVDERVLSTELPVVIGHGSGQPMPQHDEDHARYAVEVDGQIAGRSRGVCVVHQRAKSSMGCTRPRYPLTVRPGVGKFTWMRADRRLAPT